MPLLKILVVSDVASAEQYKQFKHLLAHTENDVIITIDDRVSSSDTDVDEAHRFCYKDDTVKSIGNFNIYRDDIWRALPSEQQLDLGFYFVVTNRSIDQAAQSGDFINRRPAFVICKGFTNNEYFKYDKHMTVYTSSGTSPLSDLYYMHIVIDYDENQMMPDVHHSHYWYFEHKKRQ